MTPPHPGLPTGPAGRLLALGLLLLLIGVAWLAVVSPLMEWHADRAERLAGRHLLAGRMESLAAGLPALEREVAAAAAAGPAAGTLLDAPSDALAAAALQGRVGEMAAKAGASVSSTEVLPAETAGAFRRIRLRVSVSAGWPVLTALLRTIAEASPRMLVDDVQLRAAPVLAGRGPPPLDASFVVLAFRPGAAPAEPK